MRDLKESDAESRWLQLNNNRSYLITKAERASEYTLPYLFPEDNYNTNNDDLFQRWQSIGGEGVNNLSNKMMLVLFPNDRPFFRIRLEEDAKQKAMQAFNVDEKGLENILAVTERNCNEQLTKVKNAREVLLNALKHLIVVGNCAIEFQKERLVLHTLRDFVCVRNMYGDVIEVIVRYKTTYEALPENVQAVVTEQDGKDLCVYQWYVFNYDSKRWQMSTYINNIKLTSAEFTKSYTKEKMPVSVLAWELLPRQDYGISYVEHLMPDLVLMDTYQHGAADAGIASSQMRWRVSPNAQCKPEDVQEAPNGAAIMAQQNEVELLSTSKGSDLSSLLSLSQQKREELAKAFLIGTSMVRDSERTTAEEIRLVRNELETALGGAYNRLGQELQLATSYWAASLTNKGLLSNKFKFEVVTGLEGMTRSREAENMKLVLSDIIQLAGLPPEIANRLKLTNIFNDMFSAYGLDSNTYVATEDEYAQTMTNLMQRQLSAQMAEQDNQAINDIAVKQAKGE